MMRPITLFEYQCSASIPLSPHERDRLVCCPARITCTPTPGREGHYDLTPSSVVGLVDLGSAVVEIRPKIPISRLLFLLSYALDRRRDWGEPLGLERADNLFEAIVESFTRLIQRTMHRGILCGYRGEEDTLNSIRGRLRFGEQIRRHFGRFPPAEVAFDDFTEDIELNRLLKATLAALLRLPLRSNRTKALLHTHLMLLERVRLVAYDPRQLPEIAFNRLNEHYRPAVELAKLILRHASFDPQYGSAVAPSFLIDMNGVFEDFLVTALREALKLSKWSFPQGTQHRSLALDYLDRIPLKPDLSWWEDGRCVFVGDAKYKMQGNGRGVHQQDLYQMLAYTIATDLPGGLLVYAEGQPAQHMVRHAGKALHLRSLNLSGSPEEILGEVEGLADLVRNLRLACPECALA